MAAIPEQTFSDTPQGVRIRIHLQPGAKRDGVAGFHGDALKLTIKAPPVEGKANLALRRYIASCCGVPQSAVAIVSGLSSREKTLIIAGRTRVEVAAIFVNGNQTK